MKIASITIYCNEDFRLRNWINLYNEYKDEVFLHIIVNNGKKEDNSLLRELFPNSIILYSSSSNMIHSYNIGVKEAQKHQEIDAIMQITNDIRFLKGTITALYNKLMEDDTLAVIGPVVLKKDSDIIESFGYIIPNYYSDSIPLYRGVLYDQLNETFKYVSCAPGGANMVKRTAYDKFGYQDDKIHMYCDERDMYIRFDKLGYKEGILCTAKAWHQHIYKPGTISRSISASYLTARNRIYITSKHNNRIITILVYLRLLFKTLLIIPKNSIKNRDLLNHDLAVLKGLTKGLLGRMDN